MQDIRTIKLYKWNIVGYARRHFKLYNGYLNYWCHVNAAGVPPTNSMCLNGATMIVTGDLNFELVAGQRKWFMQAGCSFCMAQIIIIFANNEVKMELTEAKNTSNNGYYASVAVTIIANTLPLSRFVRRHDQMYMPLMIPLFNMFTHFKNFIKAIVWHVN